MSKEYDIGIAFDLRISPKMPYESISQELKIKQAEVYLGYYVHKLINALEEKLNNEFNPDQTYDYGIKAIYITPPPERTEVE